MQCCFNLNVAGHDVLIPLSEEQIENVYIPMLETFEKGFNKKNSRFIVFLAGPPGIGKTTIASILERLTHLNKTSFKLQNLPMDGFHFSNDELNKKMINVGNKKLPLSKRKGSPESFDLDQLTKKLSHVKSCKRVKWPYYDRNIHDPVPDSLSVINTGVILIEGNFLLLNEPGWRDLKTYADLTILLEGTKQTVKKDIIKRHISGGKSKKEAIDQYHMVDEPNILRILNNKCESDIKLIVSSNRELKLIF